MLLIMLYQLIIKNNCGGVFMFEFIFPLILLIIYITYLFTIYKPLSDRVDKLRYKVCDLEIELNELKFKLNLENEGE